MSEVANDMASEVASLCSAAWRVCDAQQAVVNAVTPSHEDFLGPGGEARIKYAELFSVWHAETRALRRLLESESWQSQERGFEADRAEAGQ